MLPETDILNKLKTSVLVSAFVAQRVYASDTLPQGTLYPAINFFEVSGDSLQSMTGSSGLGHGRYQFNCWSPSYAEAKKIRDAVRRTLQGVRTIDEGGVLQNGVVEGKVDMPRAEGSKNYGVAIDLTLWFTEDR